jgi:hypothetical protein
VFLLLIVMLGLLGSLGELVLIDHDESWQQEIPLYVIAAALLAIVAHATFRRSPLAIRAIQLAMMLLIVSGAAGAALHFQANAEFQREIDPDQPVMELLMKSLAATAPPALAPLILGQLGLLGLVYCYKHPATRVTTPEET